MSDEFAYATLAELARDLGSGACRSTEVVAAFLDRIRRFNPRLNAYVRVAEETAMAQAESSDARRAAGAALGPLDGLPIAVKDLFDIEGELTGVGSAAFAERRGAHTATAVARLQAAGMAVLGKTQMVEFAFGGWGTNPLLGTPLNPWDLQVARIPGGSSSGSAVAVAAGLAPAALGSDTGGSVRIPASLNGVTGLKTTYGLISLDGAFPLSQTLDSVGPLTLDATDAALLAQIMSSDEQGACSGRAMPDWGAALRAGPDLKGIRIAVLPPEQFPVPVAESIIKCFASFQRLLRDLGATVEQACFPFDFNDLMRRNGALVAAEAFAIHRAYIDDEGRTIGPWVRRRVQNGRAIPAADYIDALADCRAKAQTWRKWMAGWDALLTPTLPMVACPVTDVDEQATPLAAFTRAGNYLGAAGISLPAGFDGGLPIGMQLLGKPFDDACLVQIGRAVQSTTDWHRQRPGGWS